jgi:hypothetical protein
VKFPPKPKSPPRDHRLEFIQAGLAEGFSEAQLRYLWNATEKRPRHTGKLEGTDYAGLAGFVVLLLGLAGWHWQIAAVVAGSVIMSLAWLSARPSAPRPPSPPQRLS